MQVQGGPQPQACRASEGRGRGSSLAAGPQLAQLCPCAGSTTVTPELDYGSLPTLQIGHMDM
eukprot:455333-Hanusia_phi.AAC.1